MSYELTKKLRSVESYEPVDSRYDIHLDANESFIDINYDNPKLAKKLSNEVYNVCFNRYPDAMATDVIRCFADYYGVDMKYVTAGNGSDELISVIVGSFLEKGDTLLTLSPDFSMYAFYGSLNELNVQSMAKEDNLSVSVPKIIDYCNTNNVKAVIFSNPCNPTGLGVSREDILRLVKNLFCLVIVDEAYMDFWDQSVLDAVKEHDNLIVLKTCSKAMGMAAVRMGFAVAGETVTNALRNVKSPYNTDAVSQALIRRVLCEKEYLKDCTRRICESRDHLRAQLVSAAEEFPVIEKVYESVTNFVLIRTADAKDISHKLLERSISVRTIGERYLRITAGSPEENDMLISALKAILSEK